MAIHNSDGAQLEYAVPFPYIKKQYVFAHVQAKDDTGRYPDTGQPVGYSWLNNGLIRLDAPAPRGTRVIIRRQTYDELPLVDWQDATIMIEEDLDLAALQPLHVAQENRDWAAFLLEMTEHNLQVDIGGVDAGGKHADKHAADGSDPVTPESIHAKRIPPDTGKNYLGNHHGWVEYVDDIVGGSGASVISQTHYFTGDGLSLEFTIRHPYNTLNVSVATYNADTGERIIVSEKVVDASTVVLKTISPIAAGVGIRAILSAPGFPRFEHTHTQTEPASVWIMEHSLGVKYPHVFILSTEGAQLIGQYDWANATEDILIARFVSPVAGMAIISL